MRGVQSAMVIVPRSGISTTRVPDLGADRGQAGDQRPAGGVELPRGDIEGGGRIAQRVVADLLSEKNLSAGSWRRRSRSPSYISVATFMCETT